MAIFIEILLSGHCHELGVIIDLLYHRRVVVSPSFAVDIVGVNFVLADVGELIVSICYRRKRTFSLSLCSVVIFTDLR